MKRFTHALALLLVGSLAFAAPSGKFNNLEVEGNLTIQGTTYSADNLVGPQGPQGPQGTFDDNSTLNINNFPATLRPIKVVDNVALETCGAAIYPEGSVVYSKTDFKLWRCKADTTWTLAVDNTDINGLITNDMIAGIEAAKLTTKITTTQISDNSISTPMLQAGLINASTFFGDNVITANLLVDNAIVARHIKAGELNASSMFADNIITNNMLVGSIAAGKLSVSTLSAIAVDMGTLTAGTIQQSFTAPGDDDSTPGGGLKITGGKIEAYGSNQTFGGTVMTSDGNYMVVLGKKLTTEGKSKRYPLNSNSSPANFTTDGRSHIYTWVTSEWIELLSFGFDNTANDATFWIREPPSSSTIRHAISAYSSNDNTQTIRSQAWGVDSHAIVATADEGYGILSSSNKSYGVWADGDIAANGCKAPLRITPSGTTNAPSHSADIGALWVTQNGVLYINTDGSTTWAKVGAQ